MCIFREFTTNSQQTEILSIHNDWRRKEHLLGNFKSFHKQISSNLSKRAQMVTRRMSFKRHSKAFKFPASCPENDRDFGLRSIGCRHLCSESISPPPCADPGGFQVMKAQIQRGVIVCNYIFQKSTCLQTTRPPPPLTTLVRMLATLSVCSLALLSPPHPHTSKLSVTWMLFTTRPPSHLGGSKPCSLSKSQPSRSWDESLKTPLLRLE